MINNNVNIAGITYTLYNRRSPNNFKPEWLQSLSKCDTEYSDIINNVVESRLAKYTNTKYCTLTCNGTAAIYLGMLALGLKAGDEIILPDFGYWAVKLCAERIGMTCKFVDVKLDTLCLNPDLIEQEITDKTKVICFVNHLGYVGEDVIKTKEIAHKHNLLFFEDSAQGLSQFYNGIACGANGEFGIYSFSGTKLIRTGEGGCLFTNNKLIYDFARKAKEMGIFNFVMSPICAQLLNVQLDNIEEIINNRVSIIDRYNKILPTILKPFKADTYTGYNTVVYTSKNASRIHYLLLKQNYICRQGFYKTFTNKPNANKLANEYIELPADYKLTDEELNIIVKTVKVCK